MQTSFRINSNGRRLKSVAFSQKNSKGVDYYLNSMTGKTGKTIYFFSKDARPATQANLPANFEVIETKTGMLMVREKKA